MSVLSSALIGALSRTSLGELASARAALPVDSGPRSPAPDFSVSGRSERTASDSTGVERVNSPPPPRAVEWVPNPVRTGDSKTDEEINAALEQAARAIDDVRRDAITALAFLSGENRSARRDIARVERRVVSLERRQREAERAAEAERNRARYSQKSLSVPSVVPPALSSSESNRPEENKEKSSGPGLLSTLAQTYLGGKALQGTAAALGGGARGVSGALAAPGRIAGINPLLARGGGVLSGVISAYQEYQNSGNAGRAASTGVGAGLGAWGGATYGAMAGAAVGSVVPIVGTGVGAVVGGIGGGILGGLGGEKLGRSGYDWLTGSRDREADDKNVDSPSPIEIRSKRDVTISSDSSVVIKAPKVSIETRELMINGKVIDLNGVSTTRSSSRSASSTDSSSGSVTETSPTERSSTQAPGASSVSAPQNSVSSGASSPEPSPSSSVPSRVSVGSSSSSEISSSDRVSRSSSTGVSPVGAERRGANPGSARSSVSKTVDSNLPKETKDKIASMSGAALDAALKTEGLHENRDREAVKKYLREGGVNMDPATTAWCAAWVNSTLAQGGLKGSGSNVANSFQRWGSRVGDASTVAKGDVLVETRNRGPNQTGGHVMMATGKTRLDSKGNLQIEAIGGNTKNAVSRRWYSPEQIMIRRNDESTIPSDDSRTTSAVSPAEKRKDPNRIQAAPAPPPRPDGRDASPVAQNQKESGPGGSLAGVRDPELAASIESVAKKHGVHPAAVAGVIKVESNFDSRARTGSYNGLTQIGPATFREAPGGKLAGMTYEEFKNASPAKQVEAYGAYLDHYGFKKQMESRGIDVSSMPIERQAAVLQGMQFSPYGKEWKNELAAGRTGSRVTQSQQARALGSTSIDDMSAYFAKTTPAFVGKNKSEVTPVEAQKVKTPENPATFDERFSGEKSATFDERFGFKLEKDQQKLPPVQPLDDAPNRSGQDKTLNWSSVGTGFDFENTEKDRVASDATEIAKKMPEPPSLEEDPLSSQSGERITSQVKREDPVRTPPAPERSETPSRQPVVNPRHDPETEKPSPGSDGYGAEQCDPDGMGICTV